MIDRRSVVGGLAASTAAGFSAGARPAHAAETMMLAPDLPPPIYGPRMNFEQADKIMDQLGLDAIVVGDGTNFYHATGLDLTTTKMGHTPGVYAVITRRQDQRLSLIAPAFLYYYTIAMDHRHSGYPAYVYTAPAEAVEGMVEPPAVEVARMLYTDAKEMPLDYIERTRLSVIEQTLASEAARPNLRFALAKVLRDTGVIKGRIAADLTPVWRTVEEAAPDAEIVYADDALRRIRPVKSAMEIELMRYAAQANAEAALAAARTVRAGGSVRDLRASYFAAGAMRGMRPVFMVIDRISSPTYEATFRDGQCFAIDCVSEYMGYHGDFARAVHVGEPADSMKKVSMATGKSWDILREKIKPGLRFSEVRAMGREALKGITTDFAISFTPHSVGLYHADHTGNMGSPPREDMVLEPNMVLSVDCPLSGTGMGGSSHLEDLMLITETGAEPLNDIGNQVVMV